MVGKTDRKAERERRHARVRTKISGTAERPRLCVYRSNKNLFVQVIDDVNGTTLAAAKLLKRNYIGIDASDDAIHLCKERLSGNIVKTDSKLLEDGIEKYNQKTDDEQRIINLFEALPVQRNSGIDAIIPSNNKDEAIALKFQKEDESIEECITKIKKSCKIKGIKNMIIIKNKIQRVASLFESEVLQENKEVIIIPSYKDLLLNLLKKKDD